MFRFVFFRAVDNPDVCRDYLKGHQKILRDYEIENITTNNAKWMLDESVYVIAVYSNDNQEIIGGIRLHIATGTEFLPVEDAIQAMDSRIGELIKFDRPNGCAEICGLWTSRRYFGKGLSPLLSRVAVAYSAFLGLKSLFCLAADYTSKMANSIGFIGIEDLGDNGTFVYPIPRIKARVMRIPNIHKLEYASRKERQRILSLRRSPSQVYVEFSQNRSVLVEYDFKILIKELG